MMSVSVFLVNKVQPHSFKDSPSMQQSKRLSERVPLPRFVNSNSSSSCSKVKMTKEGCCPKFFRFLVSYVFMIPLLVLFLGPVNRIRHYLRYNRAFIRLSTHEEHNRKVRAIQEQVREWNWNGRKSKMCTAKKPWSTLTVHALSKRDLSQIQIDLNQIVDIDYANKVLTVEPGMPMGQLTSVLVPQGWTIPLVPEFEILTVGGCICGTGIESSSHKYGLSSEFNISYEVALCNGELVNCSPDENSDLFYALPWSHGTLGFLTAIKIPLIPAKKYVKVEYFPSDSVHEAKKMLQAVGHDFVEGIMFGPKQFVVMYGNMVDENEADPSIGTVNHINRWYKPLFYKHVQSALSRNHRPTSDPSPLPTTDYIPLRDYLHRHTRSYFWEMTCPLPYANNFLFRLFFGWVYPVDYQFLKLMGYLTSPWVYEQYYGTNHLIQDFIIPITELEKALEFVHDTVEIYPIWLCPCKFFKKPGMAHCKGDSDSELYIDIGIYGTTPKVDEFEPEKTTRQLENFALSHDGVQFLYADSYLTREEFRQMFDMQLYDKVRGKYDCQDAFPDVYDKVSRHARRI